MRLDWEYIARRTANVVDIWMEFHGINTEVKFFDTKRKLIEENFNAFMRKWINKTATPVSLIETEIKRYKRMEGVFVELTLESDYTNTLPDEQGYFTVDGAVVSVYFSFGWEPLMSHTYTHKMIKRRLHTA